MKITTLHNGTKKNIKFEDIVEARYLKYENELYVTIKNDNTDGDYTFTLPADLSEECKTWKSFDEEKTACMNKIAEMFQK